MVNPTGLVSDLGPPQGEILVIVAGLAVLAGGIIAVDTRTSRTQAGVTPRHRSRERGLTTSRKALQQLISGMPRGVLEGR